MAIPVNDKYIHLFDKYLSLLFSKQEISDELKSEINNIAVSNQYMIRGFFKESDVNYRLAFYIMTYMKYCRGLLSDLDFEWAIHSYNQAEYDDKAIIYLKRNMPVDDDFNYSDVTLDKETVIIYLDQNIVSNLYDQKYSISLEDFLILCSDKVLFYSPNHLEEVNRFPSQEKKDDYINFISTLTKNIVMLPTVEGYCLKEEKPINSLIRVNKSIEASITLQKQYALQRENRKFLFPEYDTQEHKANINAKLFKSNLFDDMDDITFERLSQSARGVLANKTPKLPKFSKKDFKNIKSIKDRGEFIHKVKTLMIMMDLYGYKIDKKVKDGALYDPEHLCYALNGNYFITDDNRLNIRAKQIINFLKVDTKVFTYNEFISYLKQEV